MNLIGYAFDSVQQPDYIYFKYIYGEKKADLKKLDISKIDELKKDLIQRYRKIWLKACYICKLKVLKNLWYYGVGSGWFSNLLPEEFDRISGNFYEEIFAPAFGIDPTNSNNLHSTNTNENDLTIPINFCKKYGIEVLNLGTSSSKPIPDVLFTTDTNPADTLYINAWDPWSIIGNGNAGDDSLDGHWGINSNMSVLGWSMTNSKLLPDIAGGGGDSGRKSKILKMKEILAQIETEDSSKGAGKAPVSGNSTPPPSGKVAQFFMIFNDGSNSGLSGYDQCRKIVNAVKCLMAKGYKHIGLTYSANQEQTNKIWKEYSYPSANNFDDGKEKTILQTDISGTGQAQTIGTHNKKEKNKEEKWVYVKPLTKTTYIDELTSSSSDENSNFRKAFRIIPFSTMEKAGGAEEVKLDLSGNINDCITAATKFLELGDSIILGWCNQDIEPLTNSNKDSFDKDYTPDNAGKFPFAIGGGVGGKASLPILFSTYLKEYFKFLTSKWDEDVQKIVTECSPDPKSAGSPVSTSPQPKDAPSVEKKSFADVLKGLEDQLSEQPDASIVISSLGITSPPNFLYPPDGDASVVKKNLNSAQPTIEDMITAFKAANGGETNFYLGACGSIQAAYDLEMKGITGNDTSADEAKMRAKLLLNLRKNSLLLKVPARWDYATMKLGVEPELTPDEVKAKYEELQKECGKLNIGSGSGSGVSDEYITEQAYNLAEKLIPLDEKMEIGVLEEKNNIVQKDYPDEEIIYTPHIKITPGYTKIVPQENLNCGRAALANFFGVPDLLVKGNPLKTDEIFNLKTDRPETEINMGSICNLRAKYAKLFKNYYNSSDECPVGENYSINVLGVVLQILGYQSGQHIVFSGNPAEASDDNRIEAGKTATDENTLGYLVNLNKVHWICYKKVNLNKSEDLFYRINSTKESDEVAASKANYNIKQLIDMDGGNNASLYLSIYPITIKNPPATNQSLFNSFSGANNKDFYINQIKDNETNYQWKLFMKEVTSKIQNEDDYKSDEEKLKVMFYLSSLPGGIIDLKLKEKILNSSEQIKSRITQIFVDDTKANIKKIITNSGTDNDLEIIKKNESYLTTLFKSGGVTNFTPSVEAINRFYYNLNNTNKYNNQNMNKLKHAIGYDGLIQTLVTKVDNELSKSSSTKSPGGGGFKPRHSPTTNHSASKSKHNSSFKASSSKSKGKSRNRSHTQRVK